MRMLRMTRSARPRAAAVIAATLAITIAGSLTTPTLAHATPQSDLASEQQKAAALEAQIESNGNRVSVLDEQYTKAQLAIENATNQINADEKALGEKARRTDAVRAQLQQRAAELYMGSGNPSPLATIDLNNTRELGSRTAYAGAAANRDRQLLDDVRVAVEQLGLQETALKNARTAAQKESEQLASTRDEVTQATNEQQSLLSQVNGHIKSLVDQIQADKARAQEAAARAEMQRAAQQQTRAAQTVHIDNSSSGSTSSSGSNGSSNASDPNLPAPSSQAQVAVDTAKAQLGKPYVYAGSGPDSFDCSGLTQYAWAAAGVSISHNAEAQYLSLPHVSQSDLQPGDLVFFGSPIHHVGLYVGGGTMIEAPYTGVDVRYHTIYRPDYAGAARP
jgi:cell wall-associated NlpC family hydrolase